MNFLPDSVTIIYQKLSKLIYWRIVYWIINVNTIATDFNSTRRTNLICPSPQGTSFCFPHEFTDKKGFVYLQFIENDDEDGSGNFLILNLTLETDHVYPVSLILNLKFQSR